MQKAVTIDPDFAMAYRSIGKISILGNLPDLGTQNLTKAFELSDTVSRREKYIIEGTYYDRVEKKLDKAREIFQEYLEIYPEDWLGNMLLAQVYAELEEWDKALIYGDLARQNFPLSHWPPILLAFLYMAQGSYDKAQETLESYLINIQEITYIHAILASNYLCQGDLQSALSELNKSEDRIAVLSRRGDVYTCIGDIESAKREYTKLLQNEEELRALSFGLKGLGQLSLLTGRFEEAKTIARRAIELATLTRGPTMEIYSCLGLIYTYLRSEEFDLALKECQKTWEMAGDKKSGRHMALLFKGLIQVEMKAFREAQKTAEELRLLSDQEKHKKAARSYDYLRGMIALESGDLPQAEELLNRAIALLPFQATQAIGGLYTNLHALFYEPLALAYFRAGDLDKARTEYERITSLTTGRIDFGDIYTKSFYMLGKIHEQQGDTAKAIENYEKFLDLWKDADPGLPEIEDAKARLAGLKNH